MPTHAQRAFALVLLAALAPFAAADERVNEQQLQATAAFKAANPNIHFYINDEGIVTLYGEPFATGKSPEDAAAGFIARNAGIFGVAAEELMPQSLLEDKRHTQKLGYDLATKTYKHTLVYYTQFKDGFPVYNADLRLLVGNTPDFPVINARSYIRNLTGFNVPAGAQKHLIDFKLARTAAVAAFPNDGLINFGKSELVVWGGIDGKPFLPALCYMFEAQSASPTVPGFANRRFLVDALTLNKDGKARVVYSEDLVHHADITGTVNAMSTANANAAACSSLVSQPLPYARVAVGGVPTFADANGNFTIPNAGVTPVTVDAGVRGKWFRVFEPGSVDAEAQSVSVTPGVPQNFLFNVGGSEATTAEVNAYRAANQVRDMCLRYNPTFPTVSTAQEFTVNVMIADSCNAFYSANTINFFNAAGGCNDTAFGTVVHHEFGHNIVEKAGSGQQAFGEGYGDCMGIVLVDQAITGIGFSSCSGGIRTGNNTVQYPCTGEIHSCGTLLSGCVWSLRNQLLASNPSDYRDILGNLVIDSVLRHSGSAIDPNVTIDFLEADDNDNNINNGTPHYSQINAAFTAHNMDAPPLHFLNFSYPNGRPASILPATPTSFNVVVSSNIDTPQPGTGTLFYSTGSGYTSVPLPQTTANTYVVTLPAVACGSTLSYFITARNTSNVAINDPPTAPAAVYTPAIGQPRFTDNFNTAQGWTVVSTASGGTFAGAWERATPTGAGQRNDPPSDADGSGLCYVTMNGGPGSNTDVDNGTTVLTSPTINAAGGPAYVSYYRWFNTVGNTQDDPFLVDTSIDNGVTWTNLETVGPTGAGTSGGWVFKNFTVANAGSQFKIRFTASDVGAASLVEAGVDGVSVVVCQNVCPVDFDQTGVVDPADVSGFVAAWFSGLQTGLLIADFDHNGVLQPADVSNFVTAWFAAITNGC